MEKKLEKDVWCVFDFFILNDIIMVLKFADTLFTYGRFSFLFEKKTPVCHYLRSKICAFCPLCCHGNVTLPTSAT